MEAKTFDFDMTLDELISVDGTDELITIVAWRMADQNIATGISDDVSYEIVATSGNMVTLRATYTPEEDED